MSAMTWRTPVSYTHLDGIGGQHAGAADVDLHVDQPRRFLLGGEFHGNGPARVFAGEAQLVGDTAVVDLHHHAIDLVIDLVAPGDPRLIDGHHLFQPGTQPVVGRDGKASSFR